MKFINIYGMRVDMVQIPEVIQDIETWIKDRVFGNYIVISNANDAAASRRDKKIKEAVNKSSLSVPDGFSLVLLGRLNGYPLKRRVYGPDLMHDFFNISQAKGYTHFFYGSTESTLAKLKSELKINFPDLKIAGFYAPPFSQVSQKEDQKIIDEINRASPDILWVGLGCPKQQIWMYEHKDSLKVPVMVGVGAAFDFLAKTKTQAPFWMREHGWEWVFRLSSEPNRLWRRYLVSNSLFLCYFLREVFRLKIIAYLKNGSILTARK